MFWLCLAKAELINRLASTKINYCRGEERNQP